MYSNKFGMFTGVNADECPPGSYCPEQTNEPFPCPQGTYSPSSGLTKVDECLNCTAGYHCNSTGMISILILKYIKGRYVNGSTFTNLY